MKKCPKCGIEKDEKFFYVMPKTGKRNNICRKCVYKKQQEWNHAHPGKKAFWARQYYGRNKHKIRPILNEKQNKRYKLLPEWKVRERSWTYAKITNIDGSRYRWHDFEAMLSAQNGNCKICSSNRNAGSWKSLFVDHNHQTGHVRAILCDRCNSALGFAGDSIDRLKLMVKYLEEYE